VSGCALRARRPSATRFDLRSASGHEAARVTGLSLPGRQASTTSPHLRSVDGGAKCFVGGTADQDQRVTVLANATPLPDAPLVRKPSRLAPEAQ